jgi:hypothetical protein
MNVKEISRISTDRNTVFWNRITYNPDEKVDILGDLTLYSNSNVFYYNQRKKMKRGGGGQGTSETKKVRTSYPSTSESSTSKLTRSNKSKVDTAVDTLNTKIQEADALKRKQTAELKARRGTCP